MRNLGTRALPSLLALALFLSLSPGAMVAAAASPGGEAGPAAPTNASEAEPAATANATSSSDTRPAATATSTAGDDPIRLLVKLAAGGDDAVPGPLSGDPVRSEQARAAVERAGDRVATALGDQGRVDRRFKRLPYLAVEVARDEVDDLLAHPDVVSVGEDETVEPMLDRSVELVGAEADSDGPGVRPTVAGQELTGDGTSIAVIDTGVRTSHEFLTDREIVEACFLGGSDDDAGTDDENGDNGEDETGCPGGDTEAHGEGAAEPKDGADHGTHVAGIALGAGDWDERQRRGVAPDADLIAVRVLNENSGSIFDITAAMDWLLDEVLAEDSDPVFDDLSAVNLSLGTGATYGAGSCPTSSWSGFAAAAEELASGGIATIAAAGNAAPGNDGENEAMAAPACLDPVISVAASEVDDPDAIAGFSHVSDDTDLIAPGVDIGSAVIDDDQAWDEKNGTSMAAPHVAGAAALLKQGAPHATGDELRHALTQAADGTTVKDERDDGVVDELPPLAVRHHVLHLPATDAAPDLPQGLTVDVGPTADSVEVGWEPNEDIGTVHAVAAPTGHWCEADGDDGTCSIDDLPEDAETTVTLTATTDGATSRASEPSETVTTGRPGRPTDVELTRGEEQLTVDWAPPANAGGEEDITEYVVELDAVDPDDHEGDDPEDCILDEDLEEDLTCTIDGLTNGAEYTVTITAENARGRGLHSHPVTETVGVVPDAPTGITATDAETGGTINVSWDAPDDDGSSAVGSSTATAQQDDGTEAETCTADDDGTSCTISDLEDGTEYSVTVVATNEVGDSDPSEPSAPVTPTAPPGAPEDVEAEPGDEQVTVSWDPASNDGGSAITGYTVTAAGTNDHTCELTDDDLDGDLTCTINGLTNGTEYTVTVFATNAVGRGSGSDPVSVTPTAPTDGGNGGGGGGGGAPPPDEEPLEDEDEAEADEPVAPGGTRPAPPPGDGELHLDGQSTSSSATWSISTVTWSGGGISASLGASDGDGLTSPVRDRLLTVPAGGDVQVSMSGLEGGSDVVGWLFSDPVKLGSLTVDADGEVTGELAAPDDLPPGDHTLQLVGRDAQGRQVALSVGVRVAAIEGRFPDVTMGSTHWLAIERVADIGVALGGTDGRYRPAGTVTRGQMASFLARQLDLPTGDGSTSDRLTDIDGSTHADAIRSVVDAGIAQGRLDGTYGPSEPVTRGQIATLLGNAAELEPLDDGPFSDVSGVHAGAINAVEDAGLVGGFPDGTYGGSLSLTRAQMATMLVGLEEHLAG